MLPHDRDPLALVLGVHTFLAAVAAAVRWLVVGTEVVQVAEIDVLLWNFVHDLAHQISVVWQVAMGGGEYGAGDCYFFGAGVEWGVAVVEVEAEDNIEVAAEVGGAFGNNVVGVECPLAEPEGQVVAHKVERIQQVVDTDCIPVELVEGGPALQAEAEGDIDFLYFACAVVAASEDPLVHHTRS